MSHNLRPFACEFPFDGKRWCLTIYARDHDDAKRRLERIGTNGTVEGELMATIPVAAGGFLIPLVVAVRNWWKGMPHA